MPTTPLHTPSFIEIRSGVSEPLGVKIWPFPLLWLVAVTTACSLLPYKPSGLTLDCHAAVDDDFTDAAATAEKNGRRRTKDLGARL